MRNDAESADEFQPEIAVTSFPPEGEFAEDLEPPWKGLQEETREAERELERKASGQAADVNLGSNGWPLVVGDIAHVAFGSGPKAMERSGTLVSIGGGMARVRLNGSKDAFGEAFPFSRVRTEPINGGNPLKTKVEKKAAAQHAHHLAEYREALNGVDEQRPRPSDGFAHAHEAADEMVPLPRRVLQGHNTRASEGTVFRHLGNIRAHQEAVASANGKLREAIKRAKDDGVDVKTLKSVMAEMKLSTDEVVESTNTLMAYRGYLHLPSTGPINAPEPPDPNDAEQRQSYARELGIQAGFRGAAQDTNPYPGENDACHQAWADGWRDAQSRMLLRGIEQL